MATGGDIEDNIAADMKVDNVTRKQKSVERRR
jgi:hypothetical protein